MKIVYIEKSDCGATLSTWLYCNMWQLYAAEQLGMLGYINWPNLPHRSLTPHADPAAFAKQPNMYDWYFEQPHFKNGEVPPRSLAWEWEKCVETGQHCLVGQPLAFIKAFYQKHLRFNQAVKDRVAGLVAKYSIDFSNTLGISWRGCDSTDDGRPRMPIETYFKHIDRLLEAEPGLRIFATAEETTVVDKVMARYPNTFSVSELFSAPYGYRAHSEFVNPASGFERGMQTCCMLSLLSQCKHYIKNRSSSGGVASWLSNGNIICLAHPENLGHGFDITKAEHKGQIIPL